MRRRQRETAAPLARIALGEALGEVAERAPGGRQMKRRSRSRGGAQLADSNTATGGADGGTCSAPVPRAVVRLFRPSGPVPTCQRRRGGLLRCVVVVFFFQCTAPRDP